MLEGGGAISEAKELPPVLPKEPVSAAAESKYSRPSSREKQAALDSGGHLVPSARRHYGALSEVPQQLSALRDALETGESDVFCLKAAAFVEMWQAAREQMESHPAFVDELLVGALVEGFQSVAVSWHALKLACLLARADANALTLLRCGGVAATLAALEGDERAALPELSEYSELLPPEPAGSQHAGREARIMQVEVALALLQNVAYSSAGVACILNEGPYTSPAPPLHLPTSPCISGVACILNEGGVSLVLRAMRLYAAVAEVARVRDRDGVRVWVRFGVRVRVRVRDRLNPNPYPNPSPNP